MQQNGERTQIKKLDEEIKEGAKGTKVIPARDTSHKQDRGTTVLGRRGRRQAMVKAWRTLGSFSSTEGEVEKPSLESTNESRKLPDNFIKELGRVDRVVVGLGDIWALPYRLIQQCKDCLFFFTLIY